MRSKFNESVGNLSRDSGVLMPKPANGHSRSASNTSSAQFDLIHEDPEENRFKINRKSILIGLGLIFTLVACLSFVYFPVLLKRIIQSIINIKPGGEFYDFWLQSSQPTEVGIYFFHVENPWAVENGLEKLRLREMGTYMFKQRFNREISNFTEDMSIVSFNELRYFIFDEEKTTGSLDDNITVVNVPYAALSTLIPRYVENVPFLPMFNFMDQLSYRPINSFLESHNQHLFINTTIRELLYGYRLDLLDTANSYGSWLSKFGIDVSSPKLFPNNSFGILNGRNGTPDGPYEMYTGLGGTRDKFGYFKTWDGKTKLDIWKTDSCNSIKGTDGTIWPAGVNKKDRLYFFIPDICRSLYVTFQEESQFKGIPTYIFSTPDSVLAGTRSNPENECYCTEMDEDLAEQRCTLDGIFDFSACQNGIPLIVSLPHFLNADKRITDEIEGLKPDAIRHRPVLHIEPTMGTVIHGDSRLQMSIRVPPNENLRGFDRLKNDLYIPIFWGYKKLGMSNEVAKELKMRLFTPVKIINLIIICILFAGISCVFIGFMLTVVSYRQRVLMQIFKVESDSPSSESYKPIKHVEDDTDDELRRVIVRVESETSDLGDSKSDENSLVNTPRSSTIELERLVKSTETDI